MAGCRQENVELPPFNGERALGEVEALVAISPRDAGTSKGWKAARHILQRLESFGIEAEIDTFADQTPDGEKTLCNVIGRIPGKTDRWIILGSHFDTMPGIENFQGANDSGSSTGILLELARMIALSKEVPTLGILFAFFDGEEGIAGYKPGDGLHGSRHLARGLVQSGEAEKIEAMILLDMVGDQDLHIAIPRNSSPSLVKEVLHAAHATGNRESFSLSRDLAITDDHVPFLNIGIPSIDLIDFRFGSEPGLNDYWHTAEDHMEHISAQSLEITGETTLQLLKQLVFTPKPD
jgi:glutaminyl-peptide cyclotransferase